MINYKQILQEKGFDLAPSRREIVCFRASTRSSGDIEQWVPCNTNRLYPSARWSDDLDQNAQHRESSLANWLMDNQGIETIFIYYSLDDYEIVTIEAFIKMAKADGYL